MGIKEAICAARVRLAVVMLKDNPCVLSHRGVYEFTILDCRVNIRKPKYLLGLAALAALTCN